MFSYRASPQMQKTYRDMRAVVVGREERFAMTTQKT